MIGIIVARNEEVSPFLDKMRNVKTHFIGSNQYHEGLFGDKRVVLVYSRIGKVNAAIRTTILIERFGVKTILFSGVAGALNQSLHIGDLIYATRLVQHDVDIEALGYPLGFIPETGDFFATDPFLNSVAESVAIERGVKLKKGAIATGDQFIADDAKKMQIAERYKADAVEMEGAAAACVCSAFGVPIFVLRTISDAADMDACFNFDTFLKSSVVISAGFTLDMVAKL
ncbi:MAG: 5'-methylthioadenosine/adenosylhomocysteine nucleosidase [Helicobacteraceae bacterium]|jgi:adenosylhomocysteine/aminodeoxyfutalosine nucleosidase|nr:5'-methylthioadenosine/adenosylhomocysteine nucleosidase [Helicobacteraceae bacterium]